jgi:hypothetical protein
MLSLAIANDNSINNIDCRFKPVNGPNKMRNFRRAMQIFALVAIILPPRTALAQDCLAAAAQAEQQFGLPAGLLAAIGRVESGRRDPLSGRVVPWPWTIDADGTGHFLQTREAAVASVRALITQGAHLVDVGCFQINLQYHPDAFASLDEAMDPGANARAAARFLSELYARFGTWPAAIMNYHSATPDRGAPYRDHVLASWNGAETPLPTYGIVIWTPSGAARPTIQIGPAVGHLPRIIGPTSFRG